MRELMQVISVARARAGKYGNSPTNRPHAHDGRVRPSTLLVSSGRPIELESLFLSPLREATWWRGGARLTALMWSKKAGTPWNDAHLRLEFFAGSLPPLEPASAAVVIGHLQPVVLVVEHAQLGSWAVNAFGDSSNGPLCTVTSRAVMTADFAPF